MTEQHGKTAPYPGKEDYLQIATATWLRAQHPHLLAFHVPNGGNRPVRTNRRGLTYSPAGVKLKAMGTLAGVSDWLILEPRGSHHGLAVELKAKGGSLQPSQSDFLEKMRQRGYATAICWNLEAFQQAVEQYLNP